MTNTTDSKIVFHKTTLIKCQSGRYLAFFNHRDDILANGENRVEALENLDTLYEMVMEYEQSEKENQPVPDIPTLIRQDEKLPPKEEVKPLFQEAIREVINKYSMENGSDTPDYIIAKYLSNCLQAYNDAVTSRDISKI